jgi:hypothetical protein
MKIKNSDDKLNHFGSHFYVLEIKGCKALTKEVAGKRKKM